METPSVITFPPCSKQFLKPQLFQATTIANVNSSVGRVLRRDESQDQEDIRRSNGTSEKGGAAHISFSPPQEIACVNDSSVTPQRKHIGDETPQEIAYCDYCS
ncbi:hypothetical protein ABFS83_08G015800 [Erythranthe nasuta]